MKNDTQEGRREFAQWLRDNGLYWNMESAATMRKMNDVYWTMREQEKPMLEAARSELLRLANELIEQWCDLVNSGDAGNWNPETDAPIINARKVIAKATGAE